MKIHIVELTFNIVHCNSLFHPRLKPISPVLALYDSFGVDVPLNWDTTTTEA